MGGSKERVDAKALAQKVDRFRLRRWKMLLERELELHSRRHEQAQGIGRWVEAIVELGFGVDFGGQGRGCAEQAEEDAGRAVQPAG